MRRRRAVAILPLALQSKMGTGIAAGPHFRRVIRSAFLSDAIIGPAIPFVSLQAGSPSGFALDRQV
jgi:hypothetical protein